MQDREEFANGTEDEVEDEKEDLAWANGVYGAEGEQGEWYWSDEHDQWLWWAYSEHEKREWAKFIAMEGEHAMDGEH